MNCLPAPLPTLAAPGRLLLMALAAFSAAVAVVAAVVSAEAATAGDVAVAVLPPVNASAAFAFGVALPCPHPLSRSWATTGPAHRPELKPQQPDAQSESEVHGPVMNCVPFPRARKATNKEVSPAMLWTWEWREAYS